MRVLVTGGTGFIGSHLISKLTERKDDYDAYSLERYVTGRLGKSPAVKTVYADLRDAFAVKKSMKSIEPEVVIHLASISPVSYSYEHPQDVIETNLIGTVNLIEACLRDTYNFRQFLFAGTSEEYGNNGCHVQYETSPLRPASPYAVSKVACENYLNYMSEAYDFPVTILRPFNTYGRKEDYHFLIEKTIVQMLKQNAVQLGSSKPERDWLYVDDHVNAYLTCLGNEKAIGQTFNFCTGKSYTVETTVEKIAQLMGYHGEIAWDSIPERPSESRRIAGSYKKAKEILGWRPKYNLQEGLKETIKYWKRKLQ